MCWKWFEKNKDWATTPLRIVLAIILIPTGYGKLMNIAGTAGFFDSLGIPLATVFAVVAGLVELVSEIAILIGFLTRYESVLVSLVMIVAILTAHLNGTYPKALLVLGSVLALLFSGTEKLSLDKKLFKKK